MFVVRVGGCWISTWNSSLFSLALLAESIHRNFQSDFQKHKFEYFRLQKRKVRMGETLIHGGIWKVNWLSELYSCIHHNFASRITQTLAVVEPMFCHLLRWCISVWRLKSQHSLLCRYKRVCLPTFCSTNDKCGNMDAALSSSWEPCVGVPWIQGSWIPPGELTGSGPPRTQCLS